VRVNAGVMNGTPLCIVTLFDNIAGGSSSTTACTAVDCPPTAVNLKSFAAIGLPDRAILVWETVAEVDTLGFDVYRAAAAGGTWVPVNRALIPAEGGAAIGATYVLRDAPGPGRWRYRLEDVGVAAKRTAHQAIEARVGPGASGHTIFLPSMGRRR